MDKNSIKEMVVNLSNELTVIKILHSSTADENNDDGPANHHPTRDQIKKAFDTYFLESRSLPVEFFKEEYRAMLNEEFRERRKLLHDKLKKSTGMASRKSMVNKMSRYSQVQRLASALPPTPPLTLPTEDYRTVRYGNLDRILYKLDHITWFVLDTMANETYSVDNLRPMGYFTIIHRKLLEDFNLQKMELAVVHKSMIHVIDQLVQVHKLVPQICERIAQETHKRYKSEEVYSDDGSTIIVDNNEKHFVSQLISKIDNFLKQKTKLIQILEKVTTLLRNTIVYKNEIGVKFMKYSSKCIPLQYKDITKNEFSTFAVDTTIFNKAEHEHKIQSCKIFKKFPRNDDVST